MAKKGAAKKAGKKKVAKKKVAKKKAAKKIEGGCLCGAVRYAYDCYAYNYDCQQEPIEILYCHCRMCQRASGAPVVAWMGFEDPKAKAFSYTRGAPRIFRSSPDVRREFCGDCGSQLVWRTDGYVGISVGTLDDPGQVIPRCHIWTESQLAWFEVEDLPLPRYKQDY